MKKSKVTIRGAKIAAILVCAAFTIMLVSFTVYNAGQYAKESKQLKLKEERLTNLEDDINNLKTLIAGYKKEKEEFQKLLFTDRDVAAFLDEISVSAKKAEVKILNMKTQRFQEVKPLQEETSAKQRTAQAPGKQEEVTGPVLSAMPINMDIGGDFKSIVGFLNFLEKYRQLITLSNVEIRLRNYPILTCKFTLKLYSLKTIEEMK